MRDLNSVLLEGTVQALKPKRDNSGYWVEVKSRRDRDQDSESGSHRFRIDVKQGMRGCAPEQFTIGRRIRVVGVLRRESRLGPFVQAEYVEFKGERQEVSV